MSASRETAPEIIWTPQDLQPPIDEVAAKLVKHFNGEPFLAVDLLKGGMPFYTRVLLSIGRQFPGVKVYMDELSATRHALDGQRQDFRLLKDLSLKKPVEGMDAAIFDDSSHSYLTMRECKEFLLTAHKLKSVVSVVLVDRNGSGENGNHPDFAAIKYTGSEDLVGMGIDETHSSGDQRWKGYVALAGSSTS